MYNNVTRLYCNPFKCFVSLIHRNIENLCMNAQSFDQYGNVACRSKTYKCYDDAQETGASLLDIHTVKI